MDMVAGVLFLFVIVQIAAHEQRSVAECDNQSGQVYYDPKEKKCVCDRRSCHSTRNPPDLKVKEDVCVRLRIKCDKGEQPNAQETECVVCPEGTFKEDKGCDWCTPMTTCKDMEWTVFNGTNTSDRICSVTKPEVPKDTSVTYPPQTSSNQPTFTSEATTTTSSTMETIKEVSEPTGSSLSADFFIIFCILCGLTLLAVLLWVGLRDLFVVMGFAPRTIEFIQIMDGAERDEEKGTSFEKNQMCIHQNEETNRLMPEEETRCDVRTVGQSLNIEEESTPKEVCTNDQSNLTMATYNKDKRKNRTSSYSDLDFSSVLND